MTSSIELKNGQLEVALAPDAGGSIARFDRVTQSGVQNLMRAAPAGSDDVLAMACFPLVPFTNRIRGGQFECDARTVVLSPNLAGDVSPLHGQGWRGPWAVARATSDTATLRFDHAPGEWPWHYEAWQEFALDPDGLSVKIGCTNRSDTPMPCGLGLHPYFPCDAATIVAIDVAAVWTVDDRVLPVERIPAEGRYSLADRHICGVDLDNGYDGWRGAARIDWGPDLASLAMSSPDAGRFQVYAPTTGGFFAAEPVQNANAALNAPQDEWAGLGITMLAPGEGHSMTARFAVSHLK